MPNFQQTAFPTMGEIMNLARAIVNDSFPGLTQTPGEGRILTNDASFTLDYFNSAFRTLQRKLRNEGVTFPIKDNVLLLNLTPVVEIDPNVQTFVGFDGYFDGTAMHATPRLPSDCVQVLVVWAQAANTGLPFVPLPRAQEGLPSTWQGPWLGAWEWRGYRICMVGATQTMNLRIRHTSGQAPLTNVPAADFNTTEVGIIDCQEAIANLIASQYGGARGADTTKVDKDADDAIQDMAAEWVRSQQTVNYRRPAYNDGGSNQGGGNTGSLGQTGFGT